MFRPAAARRFFGPQRWCGTSQRTRLLSSSSSPSASSLSSPQPSLDRDPPVDHSTVVSSEWTKARVSRKYTPSKAGAYISPKDDTYDAIVIGGGHNGLVSAAYLSRAGLKVAVLERRHLVGGGAVTEEMVPGFKFSRASYLAGLLRPSIIKELELEKYGFKYLPRNPSSFTPTLTDSPHKGKYLLLGDDQKANWESIAQFSKHDADAFPMYEDFLVIYFQCLLLLVLSCALLYEI